MYGHIHRIDIPSILIIHGFFICEFASLLKLIYNHKMNSFGTFAVMDTHGMVNNWSQLSSCSYLRLTNGGYLFFFLFVCFSSHIANKSHFCDLFSTMFSVLSWFPWYRHFKWFLRMVSAEVLSSAPNAQDNCDIP